MVEGVVALDTAQRILYANERATQLLGLPWQAPVGRRLWEVVRQRPLLDVVQRALDSSEPQREELGWNGSSMRSLTVHAARLPGLPPRGAVLVLHDTTELRRLERLRQEFVANVSHELKTPLSVIKVCVETLLDGAMDDPRHRGPFLEQVASQSDDVGKLGHLGKQWLQVVLGCLGAMHVAEGRNTDQLSHRSGNEQDARRPGHVRGRGADLGRVGRGASRRAPAGRRR